MALSFKKLTLKIPWKNLYTEPIVATVEDVYALVVPDVAVKYNEEKEEKKKQESKRRNYRELKMPFNRRQKKFLIFEFCVIVVNKKEIKEDSFAEKMTAQIIKNLQIKVKNIHVRYEDKYSEPNRPFSIGVSLKELLFQTTDENWNPCVIKESVSQVFKFDDVLEMMESFDRMNLKSKYRKYRPDVPDKKHAEQWWHFAQNSILEDIRRRRQMWSWTNIKKHRGTMKKYRDAYVKKLDGTTVSKELIKTIDDCEKVLDICSIILVRHQSGKIAKRGAKKTTGNGKWSIRRLFGGRNKDDKTDDKDDIMHKLHEEFTPDERAKLYKAIGYEQDKADFTVPKDYIDVKLKTQFTKLSLTLRNEESKVETKMVEYTVNGTAHNGQSPTMATLLDTNRTSDPLLYVLFETNPRNGACGTRLKMTVNNLVKFFKPPEDVYLQELAQSAVAKFEKIKEQSATGLRYAIDQKKRIEISVDLQPSCVIIPEKGYYTKDARVVILDLGYLKVNTMDERSEIKKEKREEWQTCRKQFKSPMHILEPISININLQKYMLDKDTKMAKIKVSGELPLIRLSISVERLCDLIKLARSIPLPDLALHPKETSDT
ncbi:VPS13A_C [Mytilus edulis]|uniref:VPS13A_C n=1 Tax=Mytilus edulis TaxID=6550 RepID=A0A8S3S2G2_MYTED|nr:VPS13A_C [Mytilus edulis]